MIASWNVPLIFNVSNMYPDVCSTLFGANLIVLLLVNEIWRDEIAAVPLLVCGLMFPDESTFRGRISIVSTQWAKFRGMQLLLPKFGMLLSQIWILKILLWLEMEVCLHYSSRSLFCRRNWNNWKKSDMFDLLYFCSINCNSWKCQIVNSSFPHKKSRCCFLQGGLGLLGHGINFPISLFWWTLHAMEVATRKINVLYFVHVSSLVWHNETFLPITWV